VTPQTLGRSFRSKRQSWRNVMPALWANRSTGLLGPWAGVKEAAYNVLTLPWLGYAVGFLAANLFVVPGLFLGAVLTSGITASYHPRRVRTISARALGPPTLPGKTT